MTYITNSKPVDGCVFCVAPSSPDSPENLVVARGRQAYVIINRYPYTSGHVMVVPYAHVDSLEYLEPATRAEMMELTSHCMTVLRGIYQPHGFNLGMNIGAVAGAGIAAHVHLHIVPRWGGDTNFMTAVGQTRVLPEALEDTWARLRSAWAGAALPFSPHETD